jgi:hypothetical protein
MNSFWPKWQENKAYTILVGVLAVVLIIFVGLASWNVYKQHYYIGKPTDIQRTIAITGKGEVITTPDLSVVVLGYQTEKKTVGEAQKDNSAKMNALYKKLYDLNIDKKDIKTVSYNVYPQYDWQDGRSILKGYQVSQTVEVKIRDSEKISSVLDLVGQLGLNQVNQLTFEIDDPEKYLQEARKLALENAKEKASDLTKIMGVNLGKVISFTEESGGIPSPMPYFAKAEAMGVGGAEPPTIESGSQKVTVYATVTYELD